MYNIEINGEVYPLRFGFGFIRDIDGMETRKSPTGANQNIGLAVAAAGLIDKNVEQLARILFIANRTEEPKISKKELEEYIESTDDLDGIFEMVTDFFTQANCTRVTMKRVQEEAEKAKKVQDALVKMANPKE